MVDAHIKCKGMNHKLLGERRAVVCWGGSNELGDPQIPKTTSEYSVGESIVALRVTGHHLSFLQVVQERTMNSGK